MKALRLLLFVLSLACISYGQSIDTLWSHTYGRGVFDSTGWVTELPNGGLAVIAGSLPYEGSDDMDMYLIRTDRYGDTLWTRAIGDGRSEIGHHIAQIWDGGFLITGETTTDSSSFSPRAWFLKVDANGDTAWTQTYNANVSHGFYGTETADWGYAVTGMINVSGRATDVFIIKFSSHGEVQWLTTTGNSLAQEGHYIDQTADSGLVVGATTWSEDGASFWMIRLNKSGYVRWDFLYGIDGADNELAAGCKDGEGGYIFTGRSDYRNYTIRVDGQGSLLWARQFQTAGESAFNSVASTSDGNFILGGTAAVPGSYNDYCFTKITPEGESLWTYTYGGRGDDNGRCVVQTRDDNFIMLGNSLSFEGPCAYLLKVGETATGITDGGEEVLPGRTALLPNYPNPFNASTEIKYYLEEPATVSIDVIDILGRRVMASPESRQAAGYHALIWDASGQSTGVYFCQLSLNRLAHSRKMLLLK